MTAHQRTLIAAAGVLVSGLLLAGCAADEPAPTPTPTVTATSAALEPGLTDVTDTPGSGEGLEGALSDTTTDSCARADDSWAVAGTVTNSTDADASYRIYVSLLNAANDTRALVQVDVDALAAGETTDWSTDIPVAEDGLSCILRVERYAA